MTVSFINSRELACDYVRAVVRANPFAQKFLRHGYLLLVVVLTPVVYLANLPLGFIQVSTSTTVLNQQYPAADRVFDCAVTLLASAMVAAILAFVFWRLIRHFGRSYYLGATKRLPDAAFGQKSVTLTPNHLLAASPLRETKCYWHALQPITEAGPFLLIHDDIGPACWLPQDAFANEEQRRQFLALYEQYRLAAKLPSVPQG